MEMKILIISSTVTQSISVGKITTELYEALKGKGNEVKILYLDNSRVYNEDCVKARPDFCWRYYFKLTVRSSFAFRGSPYTIHRIRQFMRRMKPDIVHLIQPTAYLIDNVALFKLLGKSEIPCVYTMIDENPYLGHCDNAYNCKKYVKGCHLCAGENYYVNLVDYGGRWNAAGSRRIAQQKIKAMRAIDNICFIAPQWVVERAQQSYILKNQKFYIVDEYVNNETVFFPRKNNQILNEQFHIDSTKTIILNVAKYSSERKGVRFFLDVAKQLECYNEYLFVNVGYDGNEDNLPGNYLAVPFVADQETLAYFYSVADLYMITSLSDTMPNVCLESLSCGTPVCGFNNSGIPYVAPPPLGVFVDTGNIDGLINIVKKSQKKTEQISASCRQYALDRYSASANCEKILEVYRLQVASSK